MKKVSQVLQDALDLISKPGRWTKFASARDADQFALHSAHHPFAVCWCSTGAVAKVAGPGAAQLTEDSINALTVGALRVGMKLGPVEINDAGDFDAVRSMFLFAIDTAEKLEEQIRPEPQPA